MGRGATACCSTSRTAGPTCARPARGTTCRGTLEQAYRTPARGAAGVLGRGRPPRRACCTRCAADVQPPSLRAQRRVSERARRRGRRRRGPERAGRRDHARRGPAAARCSCSRPAPTRSAARSRDRGADAAGLPPRRLLRRPPGGASRRRCSPSCRSSATGCAGSSRSSRWRTRCPDGARRRAVARPRRAPSPSLDALAPGDGARWQELVAAVPAALRRAARRRCSPASRRSPGRRGCSPR